jgi:hypothetical protein
MATTTTNYGFDVPTSSDLVKNGATQIALLGQDLDTFLFRPFTVNGVINGGMDIWQRSTSSASNGITTADRFYCSSSGACTFSQDSTYVPDGVRYALKGLAGATTNIQYLQAIETANSIPFANKTVTLSAYVAASTSTAVELVLAYSTSTDVGVAGSWTNITATSGGTGTATTSVSRVSGVFVVPSTAKSLRILVGTSSTVANGVAFYATGIQLEQGSQASPFTRAGGTIQGELSAAQRYYQRYTVGANQNTGFTTLNYSTTAAVATLPMKVTMRVAPTVLDYSNILIYDSVNAFTITGLALWAAATTDTSGLLATGASGMTQFRGGILTATAAGGYIGLSAEL